MLADDVYAHLRDLILSNVLRSGQKLVDRDLAEQLGVSRTPIREALGRLSMTGLVEARARHGWYVSQISVKQVSDLYEVRRILETHAAKLAAHKAQPSHLREFDRLLIDSEKLTCDPTDHTTAVKLDWEIHDLIGRASGNESLHQTIQNLLDKIMCFIWVDDVTVDMHTLAASHRQHQALIKMIKKKNAERAAQIIHAHIDEAKERLERVFQAREDLRNAHLAKTLHNGPKGSRFKNEASDQRVPDVET